MSIAVFLENYGTGRRQFINAKSDISLPLVFVLKQKHEYFFDDIKKIIRSCKSKKGK
jgi:hypothetical protein